MDKPSFFSKLLNDHDKKFARNRNLLTYTVLSSFLILSAFVLGMYPCYYCKFSAIVTSVMFIPRIIQYYQKNFYLYLLDYCYYINIALIYIAFTESSSLAYGVLYTSTFYLLINVYRYGNSLVFHQLEIFTTCYMHINPLIATSSLFIEGCNEFEKSFLVLLFEASKWYCFYAALYFPLIFVLLKPFWTKYRVPNLFLYHAETPFYRDLFARMPFWGPPVYMWLLQLSMVTFGSCFAYLGLNYPPVLVGYCCLALVYTTYRAATYYIDYMPQAAVKQALKS